jgi:hypothetical protein
MWLSSAAASITRCQKILLSHIRHPAGLFVRINVPVASSIVFVAFPIMSTGLIQGQSASVVFDNRRPTSSISRSLANSLDIHQSPVSLPVNADMGFGSLTYLLELEIEDDLSFSLHLGQNWSAYYREFMISEGKLMYNGSISTGNMEGMSLSSFRCSSYLNN